jgi:predicted amidohydrolase YtcJ
MGLGDSMTITRRDVLVSGASAAMGGLAGTAAARPAQDADLIIYGGAIVTMNEAQPSVEAIAVKDGRIVAAGAQNDVLVKWKGPSTRLIELGGHTLLPGFIDAHGHFMNAPRVVTWANCSPAPVGPVHAIPDIVAALKANVEARKIAKGEWVMGYGYDATNLAEKRDLTRLDLDPHFPDNPVMVIHVSNHGAVLNSSGLKTFNVTADTPTPAGGLIAREPGSNEPAGLLMETAFMPIFAQVPQPSEDEMLDLLKPAQQIYASKGCTTAQEGATHAEEIDFLRKAGATGRLYMDIVSLPFVAEVPKIFRSYLTTDNADKLVVIGDPSKEFNVYKDRLKLGGIKFVIDGSPQGKTAFWTKPLLTGGPNGEKDWVGQPLFPKETVEKLYSGATQKNIQIWSHANGDAAIDIVIGAAEKAGVKAGDDRRHVVVHSQCMRPEQLDSYVKLGLSPSFFTEHTFFWGDVHLANLGEERAFFISPAKSAEAKGIPFSNHNDFMVTPVDPMLMVWSAVTRRSKDGVIIGPDERIDVMTALKALTVTPAWQYREENDKGSIDVGKLADLVILKQNPLTAPIDEIPNITVVETFKEGRTIYHVDQKQGWLEPASVGTQVASRGGRFVADDGETAPLGCRCCDGRLAGAAHGEALAGMQALLASNLLA